MSFLNASQYDGEHFDKNLTACPLLKKRKGEEIMLLCIILYFFWILYFGEIFFACLNYGHLDARPRAVSSDAPPSYEEAVRRSNS